MKRVLCFGEALIDFLNTSRHQEGELLVESFAQFPGGAPANAAVAVAKLGGNAAFAGQVGSDRFGRFLLETLQRYGVDIRFAATHAVAKTPLAFVFLDEAGERSFSFRRDNTADVIFEAAQVLPAWFDGAPIVHVCSNTLTTSHIAEVTNHVVDQARENNCIVSVDVNLRHNLWATGRADATCVNDLIGKADIIKYSQEELEYLSDGQQGQYLNACFERGSTAVLITDGPRNLSVVTSGGSDSFLPPAVSAVDTTGGGDAFVGAVLYGLSEQADARSYLSDLGSMVRLATFAAHCGSIAVSRQGAFPSFPVFADVADRWTA